MKATKIITVLMAMALIATTSCDNATKRPAHNNNDISEFDVNIKIVEGSKIYRVINEGTDTIYDSVSAQLQWPERLGDYDLSVLRDSIASIAFNVDIADTPIRLIESALNEPNVKEIGTPTTVDSIPTDINFTSYWEEYTSVVMLSYNKQFVTYSATYYEFSGGAHGMTGVHPFTYALAESKVLDIADIFDESMTEDMLVDLIKQSIADEFDTTVAGLGNVLFDPASVKPGMVFLDAHNRNICFMYNQYEIAPYSAGIITAHIPIYDVDEYLTPLAKKLFE